MHALARTSLAVATLTISEWPRTIRATARRIHNRQRPERVWPYRNAVLAVIVITGLIVTVALPPLAAAITMFAIATVLITLTKMVRHHR